MAPQGQGFSTDLGAMQHAAGQVEDTRGQMVQNLTQLQNDCSNIQGQWVGDANHEFTNAMLHIQDTANKMMQTLQGMGDMIKTNTNTYASREESARQGIKAAGGNVPSFQLGGTGLGSH